MRIPTTLRMTPVAIACVLGAAWALHGLGWDQWVYSWVGSAFKAASGAALGWAIGRYVLQIDISSIRDRVFDQSVDARSMYADIAAAMAAGLAGIAQTVLVVGMAIALAVGA